MITEIEIKDFSGFINATPECDEDLLQNLSTINIFIGPNNSGKSRFLRHLFFNENLKVGHDTVDLKSVKSVMLSLKELGEPLKVSAADIPTAVASNIQHLIDIPFIQFNGQTAKDINNNIQLLSSIAQDIINFTRGMRTFRNFPEILATSESLKVQLEAMLKKIKIEQRYYIPILRGLRPVQISSSWSHFEGKINGYLNRTVYDYFNVSVVNTIPEIANNIFTGLEIYKDLQDKILGQKKDRDNIDYFKRFIVTNFFPGKSFTITPQKDKDVPVIGIGDDDEPEYEIHHLGDGIQALIQLLYPIFMRRGEKALFFIEEPELSLHPGMQRLLLQTLSTEFPTMQFFLTTHSNHFLDFTSDSDKISIYSFKKNSTEKFLIKQLQGPDNHVLNDIGVRNSSVFLANCSIWVEGITDRKYVRRFLELYKKEHKKEHLLEDLHYTFVEYAGSNIVHWDFQEKEETENMKALKLHNRIFLIADSDINKKGELSEAKKIRHECLREALGRNFYVTEGKEIENMLAPDVIRAIVATYEEADFKADISTMVQAVSLNDGTSLLKPTYWNRNIGEFIDDRLRDRKRAVTYKEGNTVRDKEAFCDKALKAINSYDALSIEAKKLCERLLGFIESSNQL